MNTNKKRMTALFAVCAFAASLSQAALVTWDGGVGNWDDSNWNGGSTASVDDLGNRTTADQYTIGAGTVSRTFGLTLGSGGSFTLSSGAIYNPSSWLNFAAGSSGLIQGTVNSSGKLSVADTNGTVVIDGGDVITPWVGVGALGATIDAQSGSLTVTDANGFRFDGANLTGGALINFTGGAGSFTVKSTNQTGTNAQRLINKVQVGYFAINGTQIDTATAFNGSNFAAMNTEFQAAAVDGLYLQVAEADGVQTLSVIPEPATISMIGIGGLLVLIGRRFKK